MNQNDERQKLRARFDELLNRYWNRAYAEGKEGRDHDTETGDAQITLNELHDLFRAALSQRAEVPQDMHERIAVAHDACLDDDHIGCRAILKECLRLLAAAPPSPPAEQQGGSELSDKDRADYWQGRAIVAERKLAEQPRQMVALTDAVLEYHWNEVNRTDHSWASPIFYRFARAIERAHGITPSGKEPS